MLRPQSLPALSLSTVLLYCCAANIPLFAQTNPLLEQPPDTIRGTVVNSLTHEPVGRALVYSPDNRYAAMTDDRGHFEFQFMRPEPEKTAGFAVHNATLNRPSTLMARKIGFLPNNEQQILLSDATIQQDLTIPLVPEALVVGHVLIPGFEGTDRIQVQLLRRQMREGAEHWDTTGWAMTKSDGEFRFAELQPGSYKLLTHELLDRDPLTFNARQLFGYPPVYFPAATDSAAASVIQLSAGTTFQANISLLRREYYPVKVGVTNAAAAGNSSQIQVWPQGHPGPGYSLAFNVEDQLVEGSLPDGNYVVQVTSYGPTGMSGTFNLTVRGAPVEGSAVMLLPNSSIPVNVREEFQHQALAAQGQIVAGDFSPATGRPKRPTYLNVTLQPIENFGFVQVPSLRQPTGPEDDSPLTIANVQPGRYHVQVYTAIGFVSSVTSGGTDLLRQPLVVAPGGSPPPIEITLRDDGAEVQGKIESASFVAQGRSAFFSSGQSQGQVYFIPLADRDGQFRLAWISPDGTFQLQQLPPGVYRVLAFERQQQDLEYASEEALAKYDSKTQILRVVAGQKERLKLPLISANE